MTYRLTDADIREHYLGSRLSAVRAVADEAQKRLVQYLKAHWAKEQLPFRDGGTTIYIIPGDVVEELLKDLGVEK